MDKKSTINQQCALAAKKASSLLGCIRENIASRLTEVKLPLCSALVTHRLRAVPSACHTNVWCVTRAELPSMRDMDIQECIEGRPTKVIKGLELVPCKEMQRALGLFSLGKRMFRRDLVP